ncbi:MAG: PilZ domain-containing protein [Deltaproteobacteria bacterium]|nr:MAG: PilZ domain-containing protein [Deltaproteobacteria bacterium]
MRINDSRLHPRLNLRLEVSYHFAGQQHQTLTENISRGGAYIQTARPVDVGESLRLSLQLLGVHDPLDIQARVVWVKRSQRNTEGSTSGMGVKFVAADAADLALLEYPWSWL